MPRGRIIWAAALVAMSLAVTTLAHADTATYQYDALGRLISVTRSNGSTTTYTYDAAGNRTSRTSTGGSVIVLPLLGGLVIPVS